MIAKALAPIGLALALFVSTAAAAAPACPNGGTIRMGVEPYDLPATLVPLYHKIGALIAQRLGCKVEIFITPSYNAEIEAMRSGHLELAQFGSLGYILAHQIAGAEAVAAYGGTDGKPITQFATLQTWAGSGVHSLQDLIGKSVAFSDPASTTGHLLPAYGLKEAGIDPSSGIRAIYTGGSQAAALEAIRDHKVAAGVMSGSQIAVATASGNYNKTDFVEIWRSQPVPNDPIAVSAMLSPAFKAKLTRVLQTLNLSQLSAAERKTIGDAGITQIVPQTDAAYNGLRKLVSVLNIDLAKLYK